MDNGSRIRKARELLGWSQADLAKRAGTSQANVHRVEANLVAHSRHTAALLEALGLDDQVLKTAAHMVPVVSYVGAGAEIYSLDDHEKGGGIDQVEVPAGVMSLSTIAVIVRGDSMVPAYRDGDHLFYDRQFRGNLDALVGKSCVVRLVDGRCLVKDIFKSKNGYVLISHNADPIFDPIDWAAPVIWVKKA